MDKEELIKDMVHEFLNAFLSDRVNLTRDKLRFEFYTLRVFIGQKLDSTFGSEMKRGSYLHPEEYIYLHSYINDLLNDGILTQLFEYMQQYDPPSRPEFLITPYGVKCIQEGVLGSLVHKPNQYIDYLKSHIPNMDPRIVIYLRESLEGFNRGLYFSSSVMLGVASETLFEIFIEAYTSAISNKNEQARFERKTKERINAVHKEFIKRELPKLKGKDNFPYKGEFESAITITFDTIRSYRDFAAHPYDGDIPRDIVRNNLSAFLLFCQRMYRAIDWLKQNQV